MKSKSNEDAICRRFMLGAVSLLIFVVCFV